MTQSTPSLPPAAVLASNEEENTLTLQTRFGEVTVNTDNPIIFPQGLLGIAANFEYALTDFPSEKLKEFKLLQSLDDHNVSFITLPLPLQNDMIDYDDLEKAANDVGVTDMENLVVMLVVSVHRSPVQVKLSVNTRAPLLIYLPTRAAVQYVFQNSKYQVQHMLELTPKTAQA